MAASNDSTFQTIFAAAEKVELCFGLSKKHTPDKSKNSFLKWFRKGWDKKQGFRGSTLAQAHGSSLKKPNDSTSMQSQRKSKYSCSSFFSWAVSFGDTFI